MSKLKIKQEPYLLHQTPKELAKELFKLVDYEDGDSFYEPFKGEGSFYDAMPDPKDWTEIMYGRDFYDYDKKVDHIITNPPFRINGKNAFIPTLERCFTLANKSVSFLSNHKCFNAMTTKRLKDYRVMGFSLTSVCVCNIKKWFGRYYFLQFRRDKDSIFNWLEKNY